MAEACFGTIIPGQEKEALDIYWHEFTKSEGINRELLHQITTKDKIYESGEKIKKDIASIS